MNHPLRLISVLSLVTVLGACASTHVTEVPETQRVTKPSPGKSLVYFTRPSFFGGAIQATVYDGQQYIATVSAGTHVAYQANPGKHMFMVIGESADFMQADLLPDKTYAAVVQARMGVWKARFSFEPVNGPIPPDFIQGTKQVVTNDEGRQWAKENESSIKEKYAEYLQKWQAKPDAEKQTLRADSGR
jgi:hypothetical protein